MRRKGNDFPTTAQIYKDNVHGLHAGLDAQPGKDDVNEQEDQQGNDGIGHDLESRARHGAVLMGVRMSDTVVLGNRAQFVLDAGLGLTGGGRFGSLLALCRRLLAFLTDRLGVKWCHRFGLRLGSHSPEWRTQVSTTIGAETDALGQFLATTVAELGRVALFALDSGVVAVRGVRVIAHDKGAALILADGETLRAHDLTVVNDQFLLRNRHPFSTLWALEFHISCLEVAAKVLL